MSGRFLADGKYPPIYSSLTVLPGGVVPGDSSGAGGAAWTEPPLVLVLLESDDFFCDTTMPTVRPTTDATTSEPTNHHAISLEEQRPLAVPP